MKFKIGDRVKVVKVAIPEEIENVDPNLYINETGVVTTIDENYRYPYSIKFDNNVLDQLGNEFWGEYELDFEIKKENVFEGKYLTINLDELMEQGYFYTSYDIGGRGHQITINGGNIEEFLDEFAQITKERVRKLLQEDEDFEESDED